MIFQFASLALVTASLKGLITQMNYGCCYGSSYNVSNFGWGGSSVLLKSDEPYMNQTAFEEAKEFEPDIVVIMLGTNDAKPNNFRFIEDFVGDYTKLVSEFQGLSSKPEIWIVTPPPIFNDSLGPKAADLVAGVIPGVEEVLVNLICRLLMFIRL